jgi:outer membrane protein insertion porin family
MAVAALGWGKLPVTQVVIDAPGVPKVYALRHAFGIPEGSILSRNEIRRGVQALLATGQVEDAVVDVEESTSGAMIRVKVQPASRISGVAVHGMPRNDANRVLATLGLVEGAPLRVKAFEAAMDRARQELHDEGYPLATLDPDLDFNVANATVSVTLTATLGPALVVHELSAAGSRIEASRLWKVCGLKAGQRLTSASLEAARKRLAESLRREGFWEAEVDSPRVHDGAGGAAVAFPVQLGAHWELNLVGLKRSKALDLAAFPFVRGGETFSSASLDFVTSQVRTFLQDEGRLLAEVTGSVGEDARGKVLQITVEAGPLTPIVAVLFPGARTLPVKLLRERVGARPGHFWRWGGEPVDEETLAADASSLLGTLQDAGLADAVVGKPRIVPVRGGVDIEFPIEEGSRRTVAALEIAGVPASVKMPRLPLAKGGPWSQRAEDKAREAIESAIQDAGFADAVVTASHECDAGSCTVKLDSEPGAPSVISRIVVAGLVRTSRRVVDRVAGIQEGTVVGPRAQLEAQRRLLALGIFDRVDVHPIPGQTAGARRGLVIDVKEAPTRTVSFGFGYDTEQKTRVSVMWSELNLFGTARGLAFEGSFSSLQKRFQLTYREPGRLGLLGVPTWISVYRTQEHYTSYDVYRRGMWVELGDHFKRPFRALLRYDYQIVDPTAAPDILSQLEHDQQQERIASITPIIEWDTRDDLFSPHRGAYLSFSWQSAFKVFQADAAFDKLTASLSAFAPAQGGVLAASLRLGAIQPRGSAPAVPDNLQIPINERFFAGGRVTNRAFSTDMLGIPNETLVCQPTPPGSTPGCKVLAAGGAGMLLSSLEWRFPVYGPVGGDVFVDGGNVWQAWREVRVAGMRWGAGVGVRVDTPVGPLRLEYGWKFKPITWTAPDGTLVREAPGELFLSFGNPF